MKFLCCSSRASLEVGILPSVTGMWQAGGSMLTNLDLWYVETLYILCLLIHSKPLVEKVTYTPS